MKPLRALMTVAALLGTAATATPNAAPPVVPAPAVADAPGPTPAPERVRAPAALPPFAAQLSNLPMVTGPGGWRFAGQADGWAGLVAAQPAGRQAARWAYATQHLALGRAAEALGALEVMRQDDPDLELVPSFQLALGATLTLLARPGAALSALAGERLLANPEACAWRMRALIQAEQGAQGLGQVRCALPALNGRSVKDRAPFLFPAARAALDLGHPMLVAQLLGALPDTDPAANVLRARAQIALGQARQGQLLLARVVQSGDGEQRLDAELSMLEAQAQRGALTRADMARLRQIRFVWRGDEIELRALKLSYAIALRAHDVRATLEAGATIFRYFGGGADRAGLLATLQQTLAAALTPASPLPLDRVAGLYWEYRDIAPAGAEGDLLVVQLADRLQAAGLYERGAELLDHQLRVRTRDIAQGPLSARVASLFILAGKPRRALDAIRDTETNAYPDEMLWARHRVEAVALDQLGRVNEALAVLQDVPDGEAIRDELYWRRHDWKALAAAPRSLGSAAALNDVAQARILRLAVALAMLGREGDLAQMRTRYGAAFARLPTAAAFAVLTAKIGAVDPARISAAMAAIPTASPAGGIADLLDGAPPVAETVASNGQIG